jgi:hypothetical protein
MRQAQPAARRRVAGPCGPCRCSVDEGGELSAGISPRIADNVSARRCVRGIAGWKPLLPLGKRARTCRTRSSTL